MRLPPHLAVTLQALHPALLDACLHVYPALIEDYGNFEHAPQELRHTHLPIGIERFRSNGPGAREVWAHAVRRSAQDDPQTVTIDIAVYREDGSQAATLEGLSLKQLPPQALLPNGSRARPDWLYQLNGSSGLNRSSHRRIAPRTSRPAGSSSPTGRRRGWRSPTC